MGDQEQWEFPNIRLTDSEKRGILAMVVRITLEILFSTHLYGFGGEMFQQRDGGPIGLRGTCAIARVTMNVWDRKWLQLVTKWGLKIIEYYGRCPKRRTV